VQDTNAGQTGNGPIEARLNNSGADGRLFRHWFVIAAVYILNGRGMKANLNRWAEVDRAHLQSAEPARAVRTLMTAAQAVADERRRQPHSAAAEQAARVRLTAAKEAVLEALSPHHAPAATLIIDTVIEAMDPTPMETYLSATLPADQKGTGVKRSAQPGGASKQKGKKKKEDPRQRKITSSLPGGSGPAARGARGGGARGGGVFDQDDMNQAVQRSLEDLGPSAANGGGRPAQRKRKRNWAPADQGTSDSDNSDQSSSGSEED
jgi:hypothetical protein